MVAQTSILLEEVAMVPIQFFLVLHPQVVEVVVEAQVALNQQVTVPVTQVVLVAVAELN